MPSILRERVTAYVHRNRRLKLMNPKSRERLVARYIEEQGITDEYEREEVRRMVQGVVVEKQNEYWKSEG